MTRLTAQQRAELVWATPSARAPCGVFSSLMVLPPMLNHKRLYSALATSSGGCGSLLNRKAVIGDAACLLMRRHLCVFPVLTVGMMRSGQILPGASNPHHVLPTPSPSTSMVHFLRRANARFFFFGESYCTVVCLDPRVNDATGSARLVRRRTLDLCAGQ